MISLRRPRENTNCIGNDKICIENMISNMDYKYDYYHNSSSNEETETDFSYEIPQTHKKKKVSSYKSVSKIIDKEYLLNIPPPPQNK